MSDETLNLLRKLDITAGMNELALQSLSGFCETISLQAGEPLINVGETANDVFLIASGRARSCLPDSNESLAYRVAGTAIGFLPFLQNTASKVNILADSDLVALKLDAQQLPKVLQRHPVLLRNLLRSVGLTKTDGLVRQRLKPLAKQVAFLHTSESTRHTAVQLVQRLQQLEETVACASDQSDSNLPGARLVNLAERSQLPEALQVAQREGEQADRLVYDFTLSQLMESPAAIPWLVEHIDQFYLVLTPDCHQTLTPLFNQLIDRLSEQQRRIDVIWQLDQNTQVAPRTTLQFRRDFKVHADDAASLERVIHALRNVSIGIAMGGGAARGMSHFGVLRTLENAGVVVDRMAGTSVGAMVGVIYCCGYSVDYGIDNFTESLKLPWPYTKLPNGGRLFLLRKFRKRSWESMLREHLKDWTLPQAQIPMSTVCVDLITGKQLVRHEGDAVHAILESINLPFMAVPICRDGKVMVDGGLTNVVPTDVLIDQGCDYVIAVNLSNRLSRNFEGNTAQTPTDEMKPPNLGHVWGRVLDVHTCNISQYSVQHADLCINPNVAEIDITNFGATRRIAEIGRHACEPIIPELKQALHQLDAKLFPLTGE